MEEAERESIYRRLEKAFEIDPKDLELDGAVKESWTDLYALKKKSDGSLRWVGTVGRAQQELLLDLRPGPHGVQRAFDQDISSKYFSADMALREWGGRPYVLINRSSGGTYVVERFISVYSLGEQGLKEELTLPFSGYRKGWLKTVDYEYDLTKLCVEKTKDGPPQLSFDLAIRFSSPSSQDQDEEEQKKTRFDVLSETLHYRYDLIPGQAGFKLNAAQSGSIYEPYDRVNVCRDAGAFVDLHAERLKAFAAGAKPGSRKRVWLAQLLDLIDYKKTRASGDLRAKVADLRQVLIGGKK
jgi:hypothetical protein